MIEIIYTLLFIALSVILPISLAIFVITALKKSDTDQKNAKISDKLYENEVDAKERYKL